MKLQSKSDPITTIVYTFNIRDTIFFFTVTRPHIICEYTILGTSNILSCLSMKPKKGTLLKQKPATDNLDIFAYLNSKSIYIEKHIRDQMTALYHDILIQKCELERQVL